MLFDYGMCGGDLCGDVVWGVVCYDGKFCDVFVMECVVIMWCVNEICGLVMWMCDM